MGREVRFGTFEGGVCVRRCGEEIVTEGFGKQRDFGIGEEVAKEAVAIKGLGIREAVCWGRLR